MKAYTRWTFYHALAVCAATMIYLSISSLWLPCLIAGFSFAILLAGSHPFSNGRSVLPNLITTVRLVLILLVLLLFRELSLIIILPGLVIALILDGLDGFVARKTNSVTEVGSRLDMETDALFVWALSLINIELIAPWWVIIIGLMRYLYVIILDISGTTIKSEPVSYLKKTVTIAIIIVLLSRLLFPMEINSIVLFIALFILTSSFTHSFYYQRTGKWIAVY